MSLNMEREEIRAFFARPGVEVAPELANLWSVHFREKFLKPSMYKGDGKILGLLTGESSRYFQIEQVELYSENYTWEEWPNTRGPEIAGMGSGEFISYNHRGHILGFFKTVGAENLLIRTLREIQPGGYPAIGDEAVHPASKILEGFGMGHRSRAWVAPFYYRRLRGFLMKLGSHEIDAAEIARIEQEILSFVDTVEDLERLRIEKEVLGE